MRVIGTEPAHGADLGIAFDGDGDRLGVVDESGAIVWPDQVLLILAAEMLNVTPGACIVGDVKSSRVLFEGIARLGGRAVMAPSGYVRVREAMQRAQAPLAEDRDERPYFLCRVLARHGRCAFRRGAAPGLSRPKRPLARGVSAQRSADRRHTGAPPPLCGRTQNRGAPAGRRAACRRGCARGCEAAAESGLERLRQIVAKHLDACGIELAAAPTAVAHLQRQAAARGRKRSANATGTWVE
ncbi:MAG: hypothetical protein ACREV7_00275 [Steroidobacteraceae bacterium]